MTNKRTNKALIAIIKLNCAKILLTNGEAISIAVGDRNYYNIQVEIFKDHWNGRGTHADIILDAV